MSLTKPSYDWRPLPLPKGERLSLRLTLASGQSFRWQEITTDHWCCVLDRRIYVLRQMNASSAPIDYCIVPGSTADFIEEDEAVRVLTRHLRLDVAFTQRLQQWSKADAHFAACLKNSAAVTDGVRVLRLAPVEALISFICSSNNHIARISSMVQRLCRELGPCVGEVDGQPMYDLPPLTALAQSDAEERMRAWGFGYRARFLCETARCITQQRPGGEKWFEQLAQMPYAEAHQELLKLPGVGPKVADCICLFGLDMPEAVPVDTHLWRVACRDYGLGSAKRMSSASAPTMTARLYRAVGDCLRSRFGNEAGWAHSFLFTAELRRAQVIKPTGRNQKRMLTSDHAVTAVDMDVVATKRQAIRQSVLRRSVRIACKHGLSICK